MQPPFDGTFTSREGKESYIIREPRTPTACTLHAFQQRLACVLPCWFAAGWKITLCRLLKDSHDCADYTYGNDYDEAGKMVYGKGISDFFHWDKRDYTFLYLHRNIPMPPDEVRLPSIRGLCCSSSTACVRSW